MIAAVDWGALVSDLVGEVEAAVGVVLPHLGAVLATVVLFWFLRRLFRREL